jgi:twitching motility protein PilT
MNYFIDPRGPCLVGAPDPIDVVTPEQLGMPPTGDRAVLALQGPGAGHGAHRLGQVDHARVADRLHQPQPHDHIITIEDPIEYVHPTSAAWSIQRQVGLHTGSSRTPCAPRCARTRT